MPAQANAEQAMTRIICNDPEGIAHDYQVGWDNSVEFFKDMGYIPRLWCEGGYAGQNYVYVSDELPDPALGWYNGTVLVPVIVVDTPTIIDTPTVDGNTVVVDTPTTIDTPTVVEEVVEPVLPPPPPPPVVESPPPVVEPDPPVVVEDPPAVEPEPPAVEPEPPTEAEEPPAIEEEPPAVAEEPPPVEEEPPAVVEEPPVVVAEPPAPVAEPMVTLDNGVVLTQEVAQALELFNNPSELLSEIFSNPGAVLTAFSNIGADMSPQVRDKAEKTIVAAVIVGQIATQSAVTASLGAAAYRRKP